MTTSMIEQLREAMLLRDGAGLDDGELLGCFIEQRDEAALTALVKRHAPMVWGVCRRLLSHHDAEDAFQATFLVLVRKAASVRPREMVGNWLYGVAHQTALQARRTVARRRTREVQVMQMPNPEAVQAEQWCDVQPVLDQELSHLPDHYRVVIVLCDLEARTRKEVARQLAVPEGTVAGRLARARVLLAKRLTQRGVLLSGGAVAALVAQNGALAGVPHTVVSKTISAATLVAAGQAASGISPTVAALTEGVLKTMLLSKLKALLAVMLILTAMGVGATLLACRTGAAAQSDQPARAAVPAPAEPECFTAWGKESGGLQAGLGFPAGQHRAYQHGETATLVVRVRNVGKETVTFHYVKEFFIATPPAVTDPAGKPVRLGGVDHLGSGIHIPVEVKLAPGKEIEIHELKFVLRPIKWLGNDMVQTLYGTGKFQIQYEQLVGPDIDKLLGKLATGKLELEVKSDKLAKEPEKEEAKRGFTAWGKESGGLQAGLGFLAGQKRVYRHGETVTLVVRVRNVGKETVTFQYVRQFFTENPPAVLDPNGKPVHYGRLRALGFHGAVEVKLTPGQEIELYEWKPELRPAVEKDRNWFHPLYGTGKFQIQYEAVFGNSSAAKIKLDPALQSLATGKLELEVKAD